MQQNILGVVPLSGGYDSTLSLWQARQECRKVRAFFVAYGQPYEGQEREAVRYVMRFLGGSFSEIPLRVPERSPGVWEGRNWAILRAIREVSGSAEPVRLYLGTRCPLPIWDRYGDANAWDQWREARRIWGGPIRVRFPVLMTPDRIIRYRLRRAGFDLTKLFSSKNYTHHEAP